jgi:hypothetical protein
MPLGDLFEGVQKRTSRIHIHHREMRDDRACGIRPGANEQRLAGVGHGYEPHVLKKRARGRDIRHDERVSQLKRGFRPRLAEFWTDRLFLQGVQLRASFGEITNGDVEDWTRHGDHRCGVRRRPF